MEKKIIKLFLLNQKLKFNEIEKLIETRSNKLAYHLKNLVKKNVLEKEKEFYKLSKSSEYLIPYLSDKKQVISVILVHIGNSKKCFLSKREKRPFKDKLGLPGGRLIVGEPIEKSVERIMKEKHNMNVNFKKINSISLEHVKSAKSKVHSFLLIFATAITKENIELTNIEKNKTKIIKSDYELLKNDLNKKAKIKTVYSKT
jgi:ADP-ribose pyrophosphatase YjhB (NUDIX family)